RFLLGPALRGATGGHPRAPSPRMFLSGGGDPEPRFLLGHHLRGRDRRSASHHAFVELSASTTTRLRPAAFAAYMAVSARSMSACASVSCASNVATPKLAVISSRSSPYAVRDDAMASRTRSANCSASSASVSGATITNSSPP